MATDLENPQQDIDEISSSEQDDLAEKTDSSNAVDQILSVKVPVIVRVAEKQMTVEDVLKLSLGSIITFDKDAYQYIELMVNNSVIGLGQPVKRGEKFGLRVVQIGEITDTIKSLGSSQA